ncbi:transferase hexapeptide repeat containing protein [Desulfosarcina variabilis str. Montpellier]|uniref:transferase n=1 Tax=Desulfosarcina variabilis TaxID=2300 RepID=UPI003AFB07FF
MKELNKLFDRIIQRVNINLRELEFDVNPLVSNLIPTQQMTKFYAFYGLTPHHPLNFVFRHSNLSGSYFLGKVRVTNSLLYKSDIRGDELKKKGDLFQYQDFNIPVDQDEEITIDDSFLIKTLVHNFSHDPETLETFFVRDTVSTHYANIHGSPSDGCFMGPFSTVDLTTMRDCVVGAYSYVQAGEISHLNIEPGTVWVRLPDEFNFMYRFPSDLLTSYIYFKPGNIPQGIFMDFVEDRKAAFEQVFNIVNFKAPVTVPDSASVDRFAVIKPKTTIGDNVLVAQRAFLQNSTLGKGANAQENCYIINSVLEGNDVTAHGAKIIEADLGKTVFVGFNSFLRGRPNARLKIGPECIIMPHTIIDISKPLVVPPGHLVWGLIENANDLEANSISLKDLSKIETRMCKGRMLFEGSGKTFVTGFQERIHHILEANGAFFANVTNNRGHAQRNQNISFNTIQPYPKGDDKTGLYPTIIIQP